MPKDTFHNLSIDKKTKIFQAAVQEFSTRRFSDSSINQIIKTAGIPRGSFYQYFKDKEDIYYYMFTEIMKEKRAIITKAHSLNPDADFFEAFLHNAKLSLEWSKTKPAYNRIGMLMEIEESEFISKLRGISSEGFTRLKGMIERDKQRGLIKPEIDSDLVVNMIYTTILHVLSKEYYQNGLNENQFLDQIRKVITIIKGGIACDLGKKL